ncbi:MAG: tRNA pseudouridine(55) synthase TruB [Deltaproteobacteria bacterium]|nr:MAG: tRNA pseudouridine(55) synthase TruB [Deltaproteobacteria bacterium]
MAMVNDSLHGLIIIDKPPGLTSHTVVKRVKTVLQVRKAGHTGTLDPFATGVLIVCINEGTKLAPFLMEEEKEYEALLHLGIETDTQDLTGSIIRKKEIKDITILDIERTFKKFQGKVTQIPPMYSALKHEGVPLYLLAREGKEIERPKRVVEIRKLSILNIELPRVLFRVVCSKGTYIRALANDIGKSLGCGACLEMLRRMRSGKFSLKNSLALETLEKKSPEEIKKRIIPPAQALSSFPALKIDEEISRKVLQGKIITPEELQKKGAIIPDFKGKFRIIDPQGRLMAVAETISSTSIAKKGPKPVWRLLRVFNLRG